MPASDQADPPPTPIDKASMLTTHFAKPLSAPRKTFSMAIVCASIALGLMAAPDSAHAARKKKAEDTRTTNSPMKKGGTVKIKHQRSASEESTAERDRRLYRECRGRHNAGACLGYTQR